MASTKPKPKYQAVSLPIDIVKEVKKYVLNSEDYNSIAEFTKVAVREKMNPEIYKPLPSYEDIKLNQKKMLEMLKVMVKKE